MPPLQVQYLSFRYRTRPALALRDVSLEVRAGEIVLVAGASGCGKTTLMRCINGLIPRSYTGGDLQGAIHLQGRDPSHLSLAQISQIVGTVLQDPEKQIVSSYVANEVAFGLENLGVPRGDMHRRVDATLDFLGIAHLRDRETFYLSGGEKQKVALAGTLVMEPSILLLDEPLASLDPVSAQDALQLIRRLADEGKTILLIEHRVADVLKIRPDRVLFLVDGEPRYYGDVVGFQHVASFREVKLPAPLIVQQVQAESPVAGSTFQVERSNVQLSNLQPSTLVEFRDVTFGYDLDRPVLRDVNLTIREGDVIAVLGPNGAGKTTLVKHAIGLLKPNHGQVLVDGKDTHKQSVAQIARTLGYVFQSPTHMLFAPTVREELSFGPRNLGFDPASIDASVGRVVEVAHLGGLEDYPPLALSFGQQKRVGIAAILAMRSRILAMDEPTAGQDYANYTGFMDSILAMRDFAAVLFITHDLDLAISHANRVVLMSDGRIAADGRPEEVLADRELLRRCRIVPTSLLDLNLAMLPKTGRFMRAEHLARLSEWTETPAGS
jgi:energy-coupling factor transporter ATP-binding protein EcfA2